MEGTDSEKKMPALAMRRTSQMERKLSMSSPNNSSNIIDITTFADTSRPRSRTGRRKSSTYNRRRSQEGGIDFSSTWLAAKSVQESVGDFDSGNLDELCDNLEKMNSKSPNNSNHSHNKNDPHRSTPSPRQSRQSMGRPVQSNNPKLFSRRSSFDLSFLQASMAMQKNKKSSLESKLGMSSPNNNFNILDSSRAVAPTPRPRSRSGCRPRNRRRSMNQIAIANSLSLPTPEVDEEDCDSDNSEIKKHSNTPSAKASWHRQSMARGGMSLQSVNSGYSCYTEMTIHTDPVLKDEDCSFGSVSSSSRAYSDGDIYESNLHYSIAIKDEEYDFFEEEDGEDDSSHPDFDYEARDNGSLKTLSSAFSLDDLGSNDTVSSLSVDLLEDDEDEYDEIEVDKRLQFLFAPNFNTRRSQRPSKRTSLHSVGGRRRMRRHSNDSILKSDDYDEVTAEYDEEVTLDDSIPSIPNLPNRISVDGRSRSADEMTDIDDVEEMTADEGMDDEYIEEVLLNDTSSKRYDMLMEEESFEEEIIIDVEEITVEDSDIEYDDFDDTERSADDHNGSSNNDLTKTVEKSESSANDDNNNNNNKNLTLSIDVKEKFSGCQSDDDIRHASQNVGETKINANCQGNGNNRDSPSNLDEKTEVRANDCSGDNTNIDDTECCADDHNGSSNNDLTKTVEKTESSANDHNNDDNKNSTLSIDLKEKFSGCQSDDDIRDASQNVGETKINANCQGNGNNRNSPSNLLDEKTEVRANDCSDDNTKYIPSNTNEEKEFTVDCGSYDDKQDSPPDTDKKTKLNLDQLISLYNKGFSPNIDEKPENKVECQLYNGEIGAPTNMKEKSECNTDCQTENVNEGAPPNVSENLECISEKDEKAVSLNNDKDLEGSSDSNTKYDPPNSEEKVECSSNHLSDDTKKNIPLNLCDDKLENSTNHQNDENQKDTSPNIDEKLEVTSVDPIDDDNCNPATSCMDILLGS